MGTIKKVLCSLLVLVFMVSITACSSPSDEGSNTETSTDGETKTESNKDTNVENKEDLTIGWSVYNAAYEYFISMEDGVLAKADELGIKVITHDQKEDESEMITGVTNLIAQGVDALVISPCKPEAMTTIVELAKESDIPVIVVDIGDGGSDKDAIIISDVYGGGQMAAQYALELVEKYSLASKNAAIIKCEESAVYAIRRGEGFKSVMEENQFNIVAEITANSSQSQGYEAMQDILAVNGDDLAVVFAENDKMALGAAQAIDEAGKKGEIMVIGFDGDQAAIDGIKDGLMQGSIAQQPYEMGALGVELANTLLQGGTLSYDDEATKEIYADVYLIDENGEAVK